MLDESRRSRVTEGMAIADAKASKTIWCEKNTFDHRTWRALLADVLDLTADAR